MVDKNLIILTNVQKNTRKITDYPQKSQIRILVRKILQNPHTCAENFAKSADLCGKFCKIHRFAEKSASLATLATFFCRFMQYPVSGKSAKTKGPSMSEHSYTGHKVSYGGPVYMPTQRYFVHEL